MQRGETVIHPALGMMRDSLHGRFGARLIELRLFGPWARTSPPEGTPLDIFAAVDELTSGEQLEIFQLAGDVANQQSVQLDVVAYSSERAQHLRAKGRRLLRDVDRYGLSVLREAVSVSALEAARG